jgi:hypothetical protein
MSCTEQNVVTARRFLELSADDCADALVSPTWSMYGGPPGLPPGPAGLRQLVATTGRTEQSWHVDDVIAAGDKVVVRATNTCVQDSYLGIPAHGRCQVFTATFIHQFVGGRIEQTWRTADDLRRLHQLGARIKPGPARRP